MEVGEFRIIRNKTGNRLFKSVEPSHHDVLGDIRYFYHIIPIN